MEVQGGEAAFAVSMVTAEVGSEVGVEEKLGNEDELWVAERAADSTGVTAPHNKLGSYSASTRRTA